MEKELIEKVFQEKGIELNEGQDYLDKFKSDKALEFAVIKISGDCLQKEESKKAIVEDLWFLSNNGLYPIVMHGAGKIIDKKMKENGLSIEKINGLRKTDKKTLELVIQISNKINSEFVEALKNDNDVAVGISGEKVFEALPLENETYGFVGKVGNVFLEEIEKTVFEKKVPIITSIGFNENQFYNINADEAANHLVNSLKPHKFILLTTSGGVLDKKNNIISDLNLDSMKKMIEAEEVTEGMKLKLENVMKLLEEMPKEFTIQITSPKKLINELFSRKGSGTLCQK